MKQRFLLLLAVILLLAAIVGLNAASYVQKEKLPDNEVNPNRSTYNAGSTGTKAFFETLAESGRRVVRWQLKPSELVSNPKKSPDVFVIIGVTRREITEEDINHILDWVSRGGRLVMIDRTPLPELMKNTHDWEVRTDASKEVGSSVFFTIDPADTVVMTDKVEAAKPSQPTLYTKLVNSVQPSRLASSVSFNISNDRSDIRMGDYDGDDPEPPPPPVSRQGSGIGSGQNSDAPVTKSVVQEPIQIQKAPVTHLANRERSILVDFPYGAGSIVVLSDPFIVSNSGIKLVDNLQLGINLVSVSQGTVAFDEYHQGFGENQSQLAAYFSGTPLFAILGQLALLVLAVLYTQSRRFARPLPVPEPDRLSKLEYVSAMAELQNRTKAYDLAIENIYSDLRRRAARLFGVDNFSTGRKEMAGLIAERVKMDAFEVYKIMQKAEDIIHGEMTGRREVVELAGKLRDLESKLGMKRQRKEAFRK